MLLKMSEEPDDYEGPWPKGDAMTKPTVESVMRMIHDNEFMRNDDARDQIRAAIESLIAAPASPVQQAEPVAYAVIDPSGDAVYSALLETRCIEYRDNEYRYGNGSAKHWVVRPTFLDPPPAEVQQLRAAAQAVVDRWDTHVWKNATATGVFINALRAALKE